MDPNQPYNYQNSFQFSKNFLDLSEEQRNHPENYLPNTPEGYPFASPFPNIPSSYGSASTFQQLNSQQYVSSLDDIHVIPEPNPSPERDPKKTFVKKHLLIKHHLKKFSRQGGEKRNKWSQDEELLLTSTNQKCELFWDGVTEYYNKRRVEENKACGFDHIKIQGGIISLAILKASNRRGSGENEVDVIRNAHTFFHVDYGVDFLWEHVWREVQHEPKWCNWLARESGGSSKRSKLNESGIYSSSSNPDTPTSVSGPESVTFSLHDSAPLRPTGIKNLEKVDRLTMLQANRVMQKQEAKIEAIKE
ncbi:LOW QUALITY PROTEIN: hypothetical protein V2J09_021846 [Rumex salicifolius]